MNKLGVRDGQKPPMGIFWVSEEMGKALKHLSVDFPALWQKHGQMNGVQTTQYLSFQNIPHTLRILVTNIQTYTLHSYKSNFDISFQVSTSIFALLTGLFAIHTTTCNPESETYTQTCLLHWSRGLPSLYNIWCKKNPYMRQLAKSKPPLSRNVHIAYIPTVCFSDA